MTSLPHLGGRQFYRRALVPRRMSSSASPALSCLPEAMYSARWRMMPLARRRSLRSGLNSPRTDDADGRDSVHQGNSLASTRPWTASHQREFEECRLIPETLHSPLNRVTGDPHAKQQPSLAKQPHPMDAFYRRSSRRTAVTASSDAAPYRIGATNRPCRSSR